MSNERIVYIPCKSGNDAFSECAIFHRPGSLLWLMGAGPGSVRMEFAEKDALRLAQTILDMLGVVPEIPSEHVSVPVTQEHPVGVPDQPMAEAPVAATKFPPVAYCPYCGSHDIENQTCVFFCAGCKAVFAVSFSQFLNGTKDIV